MRYGGQTTKEVRLDVAARQSVSRLGTINGGFGRLLLPQWWFYLAQDARRDNHDLASAGNPGMSGKRKLK